MATLFIMGIYQMLNPIKNYSWGSKEKIAGILGIENKAGESWAELWMGANKDFASKIIVDEKILSLKDFINKDPSKILGKRINKKFGSRLPFIFKILSAETPLSLQVHPNLKQAQKFYAQKEKNIEKTYRDANHKPEMIFALENMEMLYGFKKVGQIKSFFKKVDSIISIKESRLFLEICNLKKSNLKNLVKEILKSKESQEIIKIILNQREFSCEDFELIQRLNKFYPEDPGILLAVILNHIYLKKGDCFFINTGIIHSYLYGTGLEIMADSDNVLRCGLTKKHMDIDELLKVLKVKTSKRTIIKAKRRSDIEKVYLSSAKEFYLKEYTIKKGKVFNFYSREVSVILCLEGRAKITNLNFELEKGKSYFFFFFLEKINFLALEDMHIFRAMVA